MKQLFTLIASDFKNTLRDPALLLIMWIPLLMLAVVRWGLPVLGGFFPDVQSYYLIFITFFSLLNSIFPGFILSFMLLDEKDLHILPTVKVTPVSVSGILGIRIATVMIYGFICSFALIHFNGLIQISLGKTFSISLLNALNAPILVLLISAVAKNKVEGLTLLKVANILIIIPVLVFFIDSDWEHVLAILPAFWPFKCMESEIYSSLYFIVGFFILIMVNYLTAKFAIKRLVR